VRVLDGPQVLMRVFVSESDHCHSRPLYEALVELFHRERLAGVSVLRGIAGFGTSSHLHTTKLLRLSQHLPIVIEVVDSQENVDRVLPQIESMMTTGLITFEEVRAIRYAPTKPT
jgi:PII-like signaling protein